MTINKAQKPITRRDFLRVSGAALGAAIVAGCVPPPTATPEAPAAAVEGAPAVLKGATINFLSYGWFVPELLEAFQDYALDWATGNGVKFNLEVITSADIWSKLAANIEAKQGPNLVQTDVAPANWKDATVDVTDVAEELQAEVGEYYQPAQYMCKLGGQWRGIPYGTHPHVMVYRTDWFKEQGYDKFPDTWDEVYEAGVKLKEAGHPYGFTFSPTSPSDGQSHTLSLLWSFGGKEFNPDGSIALDSPETVAALEFVNKLFKDCCDPAGPSYVEASNNQAFLGEQISATINVNSIYLPAKTNNPQLAAVMDHAPHPEGPGGRIAFTKVPYMMITSYTEGNDREACKQFMRDFFSTRGYAQVIKEGQGYLVPCAPAFEDLPVWPTDPKLAYAKEQAKIGRMAGYDLPESNALVSQIFTQGTIQKMFVTMFDTGDAKEAIATAVKDIEDMKNQLGMS